jgi:archaellum biogenesis ATPase FlaH
MNEKNSKTLIYKIPTAIYQENNFFRDGKFKEEYGNFRITMDTRIPKSVPLISIEGNIISTAGNLTMISGDNKAGKSTFSSIIIAGAIRGHNKVFNGLDYLDIDGNIDKKAVIHIDTEQSIYDHKKKLKDGVLKRIGLENGPSHLHSFNYRTIPREEMLKVTHKLVSNIANQHGGIHLIVIDGIADFITSVNDEQQGNYVVSFFEKLAMKYNCPILVIMHLNPGNKKERGHLGSQLQRKAESVLQIIKDKKEISCCVPHLLRNANKENVPILQFTYDEEKKYHVYAGIGSIKKTKIGKGEKLRKITLQVFSDKPISYGVAVSKIQEIANISERTAKDYIKKMSEFHNFIKKIDNVGYVSLLRKY